MHVITMTYRDGTGPITETVLVDDGDPSAAVHALYNFLGSGVDVEFTVREARPIAEVLRDLAGLVFDNDTPDHVILEEAGLDA